MEHAPSAFPEARGPIGQMIQALSWEAQGIPVVQHLAPRHTKPGTLDLTASTLFVRAVEKHALICKFAQQLKKVVPFRHGQANLSSVLEMFFRTLHALHLLWSQKTQLTPNDLTQAGLDWMNGLLPLQSLKFCGFNQGQVPLPCPC